MELLVVMAILGTVLSALVASFATAMAQEVDQGRREQAYSNARLALQRMRLDIHCSTGLTSVDQNAFGGFTLTLAEANDQSGGWCPGVIPSGDPSSGVQWCTVQQAGSTTRWTLFRFLGLDPTDCGDTSSSTFQVDFITAPPGGWPTNATPITPPTSWQGNIWPDSVACSVGTLPTLAIDLTVALDPVKYPSERYELRDEIALRNADRGCT